MKAARTTTDRTNPTLADYQEAALAACSALANAMEDGINHPEPSWALRGFIDATTGNPCPDARDNLPGSKGDAYRAGIAAARSLRLEH